MIQVNKKDISFEFILPRLKLHPGQLSLFSSYQIIPKIDDSNIPFLVKVASSYPCLNYIDISKDVSFSLNKISQKIYKRTTYKLEKLTKFLNPLYYNKKIQNMVATEYNLTKKVDILNKIKNSNIKTVPIEFLQGENLSPKKPKNNFTTSKFIENSNSLINEVNEILFTSKIFLIFILIKLF